MQWVCIPLINLPSLLFLSGFGIWVWAPKQVSGYRAAITVEANDDPLWTETHHPSCNGIRSRQICACILFWSEVSGDSGDLLNCSSLQYADVMFEPGSRPLNRTSLICLVIKIGPALRLLRAVSTMQLRAFQAGLEWSCISVKNYCFKNGDTCGWDWCSFSGCCRTETTPCNHSSSPYWSSDTFIEWLQCKKQGK